MRLATIRIENPKTISEKRDGRLVVVSEDGAKVSVVPATVCPNLLEAIQDWGRVEPNLLEISGGKPAGFVDAGSVDFMAPLPQRLSLQLHGRLQPDLMSR